MSCFLCCCGKRTKGKEESTPVKRKDQQDLTTKSSITHCAIEELKSKLINKESDSDETMIPETEKRIGDHNHSSTPHLNEDGLILPRKPANPVKENPERQNLHRELAFNQKIGKNVLNQKSELQRALEKQKEILAKKELENNIQTQKPELEKVIAERAKKLEEKNNDSQNEDDKVLNSEFLQARMKLKTRTETK
ncbi:protein FAM107B isoform X2 [Coccinella septempunctata]|uniref:protein FAM107B isoform X2 n=1 Tax=Coccinella septempunctata TaxID=41139 RepID=UPI001D073108|nr:protein FAM107B isoform X2 [Coccinella septempunctata]